MPNITWSSISSASISSLMVSSISSPGARAGGMGEAQVAIANDAYASYWNPAGLAFQEGSELAIMHVNWLPNLADDLYYEFLGFRKQFPTLGTLGGHLIYLNLGEQVRMDEYAQYQGKFTSYMMAAAVSYSTKLSSSSSFVSSLIFSDKFLLSSITGSGIFFSNIFISSSVFSFLKNHLWSQNPHCNVLPSWGINDASTLNFLLQEGHVIIM